MIIIENKEIVERLTRSEERGKSNSHRISNLENSNEILHEMKVLMEVNTNTQKDLADSLKETNIRQGKFDDRLDSFDTTLSKVNENLTYLNSNQESMRNEMAGMKEDIVSTKNHVKEVEKMTETNEDRGKFDVIDFISKDLPKAIGLALIGAMLAYFGLK